MQRCEWNNDVVVGVTSAAAAAGVVVNSFFSFLNSDVIFIRCALCIYSFTKCLTFSIAFDNIQTKTLIRNRIVESIFAFNNKKKRSNPIHVFFLLNKKKIIKCVTTSFNLAK